MKTFFATVGVLWFLDISIAIAYGLVRDPDLAFEIDGQQFTCYEHINQPDLVSCDIEELQEEVRYETTVL